MNRILRATCHFRLLVPMLLLLGACEGRLGQLPALDADFDSDFVAGDADSADADFSSDDADLLDADRFVDADEPPFIDIDGDGYQPPDDCDDGDPRVHPDAAEVCDGVDNNCDGVIDEALPASCPDPADLAESEGGGLIPTAPEAFVLADDDSWETSQLRIDALELELPAYDVAGVLDHTNRFGVQAHAADLPRTDGFIAGFRWNNGDRDVDYWYPQGITGSADASEVGLVDGKLVLLVSWHYSEEAAGTTVDKGVRISFIDASDPSDVSYRHVLLVEPYDDGGVTNFRPVTIHAGGIVWLDTLLFVADTSYGLRVFDLDRMLEVETSEDVIGLQSDGLFYAFRYRFVLPQVTRYSISSCSCAARFSFVSIDRSSSPPSLVTGNYVSDAITGMLYRWPVDDSAGLLLSVGRDHTPATGAWVAQHSRMQGALGWAGNMWISSSSQDGRFGRLYRTAEGLASAGYDWVDGPEDLHYDEHDDALWSATEDIGDRWVFAVRFTDYGG